MNDGTGIGDAMVYELTRGREASGTVGILGTMTYELFDKHGDLKQTGTHRNLVTRVGNQYYGDRAAQINTAAATLTVLTTGATSTATTSGAHGFGTGDVVTIAGVTPSGYNGSWAIATVPSTTTFTIYLGTSLGAGTVFGTATSKCSLPFTTGMRLGTGTTAVATTGAGAAIVTYATSNTQNKAFDSTYPQSSLSTDTRVITYKTTWNAGEATQTALAEVVISFETPFTDVAGTAANTISRALLSPTVNKGASDTLAVTWTHNLLGA